LPEKNLEIKFIQALKKVKLNDTQKKSGFVLLFFETDMRKMSLYRAFIFPLYLLLLIACKLFQTIN
jgi:hypothetical protein